MTIKNSRKSYHAQTVSCNQTLTPSRLLRKQLDVSFSVSFSTMNFKCADIAPNHRSLLSVPWSKAQSIYQKQNRGNWREILRPEVRLNANASLSPLLHGSEAFLEGVWFLHFDSGRSHSLTAAMAPSHCLRRRGGTMDGEADNREKHSAFVFQENVE